MSWSRFNPKREARPSQTEALHYGTNYHITVSIPNGKPGPLRHDMDIATPPNTMMFQSQTGSQALSDDAADPLSAGLWCFNPKREARPSQT